MIVHRPVRASSDLWVLVAASATALTSRPGLAKHCESNE